MKYSIHPLLALSMLAFLHSSAAAPSQGLQSRQASTEWADPYIKEPTNFQLRKAGSPCSVQFSFERDIVDSRYAYRFQAEYPSGERTFISPVAQGKSGDLPISRAGQITSGGKYSIGNGKILSAHTFEDVCSASGSPPSSVYALTELDPRGYTYRNNFTSSAIGYSNDNSLPGVPAGVVATKSKSGNQSTTEVSWEKVEGATEYFVLYKYYIYASELGSDVPAIRTGLVGADVLEDSQNVDAEFISVIARRGSGAISKTTQVEQILVINA